jgi:hypothetical protein
VEVLSDDGDPTDRMLYEKFHLDEPWDGPHNKTLIEQIPWWLQDPEGKKGQTCYLGVQGKDCAFDNGKEVKPPPLTASTHVIAIVMTKESCPWTKPADVAVADVEKGDCLRWFKMDNCHTRADTHEEAHAEMIMSAGSQKGWLRSNLPVKWLRFDDAVK